MKFKNKTRKRKQKQNKKKKGNVIAVYLTVEWMITYFVWSHHCNIMGQRDREANAEVAPSLARSRSEPATSFADARDDMLVYYWCPKQSIFSQFKGGGGSASRLVRRWPTLPTTPPAEEKMRLLLSPRRLRRRCCCCRRAG